MKKNIQQVLIGDVFAVRLYDGTYSAGQIVDISIPHTVSCAFFDHRAPDLTSLANTIFMPEKIVARATVIDAHLSGGAWPVVSHLPVLLAREDWPNERTRAKGWVGSKVYTGKILEDFFNAFFRLAPWDPFHDPHYLDNLLLSPSMKPKDLIYKS